MKRRILSTALALSLFMTSAPAANAWQEAPAEQADVLAETTASTARAAARADVPSPTEVYNTLISYKGKSGYMEGTSWNDDNQSYDWHGGKLDGKDITGRGCVAFAFRLSDAAFGNLPNRKFTVNSGSFANIFPQIKPGDILRMNNNTHTVIVLEVSEAGVIVAEGNYSGKVHWGRVISKIDLQYNLSTYITRYPEGYIPPTDPTANDPMDENSEGTIGGLSWKLTKAGTLTISGRGAMPDFGGTKDNAPTNLPWQSYIGQIRKIIIEDGVTRIGNCAFYGSGAFSVEIPSSVETIGNCAFYKSSLIYASIPAGVKSIGDDAFSYCANLFSVTVAEGVKTIGERAFCGCTALSFVELPSTIQSMGAGGFSYDTGLNSVTFAYGNTNKVTMGANLFSQCHALWDVTLPERIDCISDGMFQICRSLTSLRIPEGAASIGGSAFSSCISLGTVIIPDSVTSIGIAAFSASSVSKIRFTGTEAQWKSIQKIGDSQSTLSKVPIEYNFTPPHAHQWINDEIVTPATCTADAKMRLKCLGSGCDEKTRIVDVPNTAGAHQWGEFVVTKEPTETEAGVKTATCSVCGETKTEIIPATGDPGPGPDDPTPSNPDHKNHINTWGSPEVIKEATCTEDGEEKYTCTVPDCGEPKTEKIPALGHDYGEGYQVTKEPTENEPGEKTATCSRCGSILTDDIPALGHVHNEYVTTKAPTCTQNGEKTSTCSTCGRVLREIIPATGHSFRITSSTPPSCTTSGRTNYRCANGCGQTWTDTSSALGHNYRVTSTTAATCTEAGSTVYTCTRCGLTRTETTPATGHEYDEQVTAATCTEEGEKVYSCSKCDTVIREVLPALGHSFDFTEATKATCTEDSVRTYTCRNECGLSGTEIAAPATGHKFEVQPDGTYACENCDTASIPSGLFGAYEKVKGDKLLHQISDGDDFETEDEIRRFLKGRAEHLLNEDEASDDTYICSVVNGHHNESLTAYIYQIEVRRQSPARAADDDVILLTEPITFILVDDDVVDISYTITFDANGGGNETAHQSREVAVGETYRLPQCRFTPPDPDTMRFKGWLVNGTIREAGAEYIISVDSSATDEIVITAVWQNVHTIRFVDANGVGDETLYPTLEKTDEETFTLPETCEFTAPAGMEFKYWDVNGTICEPGAEYVIKPDHAAEIVVTAVWGETAPAPTYAITLNANGGTLDVNGGDTATVSTETAGTLVGLPEPTLAGHTFGGWYTEKEGGVLVDTNYVFERDTTIYAHWTADVENPPDTHETYTVTFDANGGEVPTATLTTDENGKLTVPLPVPTRPGYTFNGWYTAAEDGEEVTAETKFTENTKLYARWTEDVVNPPVTGTYTVTFNANGGEVEFETAVTGTDGKLASLPAVTRAGHIFNGWYTAAEGGSKADENRVYNENTTLYAHWILITVDNTVSVAAGPLEQITVDIPGAKLSQTGNDYVVTLRLPAGSSRPASTDIAYVSGTGTTVDTISNSNGWTLIVYDEGTGDKLAEYTILVEMEEEAETCYISVPSMKNGEVIPSVRYAERGERVTLSVHPDTGYELGTLTVRDIRGRELTLRDMGNGRYSFTMPDTRVTVEAEFETEEEAVSETSIPGTNHTAQQPDGEVFTGLGTPGISGIVLNPTPMTFMDVRPNDWYYENVDYVWKHYLMSGVSETQFAPNATTSRAMIWTVLARMNNVRTDINPGSTWFERGMEWAMEHGVTDGSNAMGDITREQLATMLWRNANSPSGAGGDLSQFSDGGTVSGYAQTAVRWAVANGILNGSNGMLNPKGTATRAQVAAMVARYGDKLA